jgi:3-hydroxybutyryl-CoA dehydratase
MANMESAQLFSYEDLVEGLKRERTYLITPEVYEGFLRLFGDCSPLHVDAAYAKTCGFSDTLMHGAILNGFISHFIGMVFPGGRSLELSVDIRFLQPSYLGDTLRLQGKIAQKLDLHQVIVLHLTFVNQTSGATVATGRVQVKLMSTSPSNGYEP